MTKIKARDLRRMSVEQLNEKLTELRKDFLKISAQKSTGTALENPGRVKAVKKTITRILTIITEKKSEKPKKKEMEAQKKQ